MATKLSTTKTAELLSYIINQNPILKADIDLPTQGQDVKEIGKIILSNNRYKNAFINTVNLIGVTLVKKNEWENPWDFTTRGQLRYGQQVREIVNDLVKSYDYNKDLENEYEFAKSEVPNVLNYIHEVNFQRYYKTTISDAQVSMAFDSESSLYEFITDAVSMLYQSYIYDTYIIDKYMLCRRILDGTMTVHKIEDFANKDTRKIVAEMKNVSNKMTFRKPNYNPAGLRKATKFEDQICIVNTDFDSKITTEVLATSYFKNDAEMKTQMALIDGFGDHDTVRLAEVLESAYVPFTEQELTALAKIPAVIISKEWFMDYYYAIDSESDTKETNFYNPQTLKENTFLHVWRVFSTSPFENACVFGQDDVSITSITVSPATASITAGQRLQLTADVKTTGFANKGVMWAVDSTSEGKGITVNADGQLIVPTGTASGTSITVCAKSIYDNNKEGTATITVA